MRVAIYARKSTEEHQAESLETQHASAHAYAAARGWSVTEVVDDSGVSRDEFLRRPGLRRIERLVKERAIDVVLTRDETRIGGDMLRTLSWLRDRIELGAQIWYYSTNKQVLFAKSEERLLGAIMSWKAEAEREAISSRTAEAVRRKASSGYNAGGRVFGYKNRRVYEGPADSGRKIRTEYEIDEREAEVIRRIFAEFNAGKGIRAIAGDLNDQGIASPRAASRGTGSWSPSVIHAMVRNERYAGTLIYGRKRKSYKGGTKIRLDAPPEEWVIVDAPHLQIIARAVWEQTQTLVSQRKRVHGAHGKTGPKGRYLLTGLARCAICNGPIQARSNRWGKENIRVYMCAWHDERGSSICGNKTRRPVAALDAVVLTWLRRRLLSDGVLHEVIEEVRRRLDEPQDRSGSGIDELETRATALRRDVDRLTHALTLTDTQLDSVVKALAEKTLMLRAVEAQVAAASQTPMALTAEMRDVERLAKSRLADLQGLMSRNPDESKVLLETLLTTKLRLTPVQTPEGARYRIEGMATIGPLLFNEPSDNSSIVCVPSGSAT